MPILVQTLGDSLSYAHLIGGAGLAISGPPGEAVLRVLLVIVVALCGTYLAIKILAGVGGLIGGLFGAIGRLIAHVFGTLGAIFQDSFRILGSLATGAVFLPMALGSVALGRWSAARHFAGASKADFQNALLAAYRVTISHPLKLVGVHSLVEGFEQRLPAVLSEVPGRDRPRGGKRAFDGYEVIGSLPPGGSGAQLFRAKPTAAKRESYGANGLKLPDEVVIKSFDLQSGSTLPQIVRENRALQAARSLGLVLEHELSPTRFHYVMPFVPGQDLSQVGRGLHARSGAEGLSNVGLRAAMGYTAGLLEILERFHGAGLWHKDIKPSNVIVNGERVELVDLGLVTPLASALTLTTHGTEYYRDPEMVRLAMQGVKVHEVDGVKFDMYSVGAVLYGLIENSFPAHGSLSRIGKRCPEALKFVVQRAMSDLKDRYGSASAMLADLRTLLAAADPFAMRPVDLPSLGGAPRAQFAAGPAAAKVAAVFANLTGKQPPPLPSSVGIRGATQVPPLPQRRAVAPRRLGSRVAGTVGALFLGLFVLAGLVAIKSHRQREQVQSFVLARQHLAAQQHQLAAASQGQPAERGFGTAASLAVQRPMLLVLRTPQAVTLETELQLSAQLEAVLPTHVFSERSVDSDQQARWAAEVRNLVQLGDLNEQSTSLELQCYLQAEPQLGAVLWLEPNAGGDELRYLWIGDRQGATSRISGRVNRAALPSNLASQAPVLRALAGREALAPFDFPGGPATASPDAFRAPQGRLRVDREALERAREALVQRRGELSGDLESQAAAHAEQFEEWAGEVSESFDEWAEELGERFESWESELEEQLEETLEECQEQIEEQLEAARLVPR